MDVKFKSFMPIHRLEWEIPFSVIPHSKVGNKPERGIGETHAAATLNGP